jgi:hypothetical protein
LAKRILEITGSNSPIVCEPARGPEVDRFCADTRAMREVLGIEPPLDPVVSIADWWERA